MTSSHRIASGFVLAAVLPLAAAASTALGPGETGPSPEEELERGRYWHASRLLAASEDESVDPLLRARAEAGWGNWPEVWELLQAADAVPSSERAEARALRARAAEETGRSGEAAASYRAVLADGSGLDAHEARVLRIRLGRVLAEDGAFPEALDVLEEVAAAEPAAGAWLALEIGRLAAEEGRPGAVGRAMALISGPEAEGRAWDLPGRAHLAAGDTVAALIAYLGRAGIPEGGEAWSRVGTLRLALGDTAGARRAFRIAVSRGPAGSEDAARALLELGIDGPGVARRSYRALSAAAQHESALAALERWRELAADPLPDALRLERARLLSRAERPAEAVEELRPLAASDRAEVAAPALDLWAGIRRRQGRAGDRRILQDRLVERFPSRPEAVDVVYFRADDRHDRGDLSGALDGYGRVVEMAPELDRAGLARMRMGQIHVSRGMYEEAAEVFEGYLDAFPRGRRWDEARFWAAWSQAALGRDQEAREHVRRIQEEDPLSYYAILGARLLGEPYEPDIPEGEAPPEVAAVDRALTDVEILREAGLEAAVPGRIDALRERYRASGDTLLRLALELSERGFSLDGITLGWQIRGEGREWDRWLVRAVYPYPYRELVRLEAEEWGLDPVYLAALIRQESAFLADARSVAGAMGLMQVVPSTGRSLARAVGPEAFAERHLLNPELNLHLGAAYLARLHERFEERTALTLAAYNAGPTRARRWERRYPEVEDPLRFTERIPFRETRGYVKRVTRNLDIYRWLYGEGE